MSDDGKDDEAETVRRKLRAFLAGLSAKEIQILRERFGVSFNSDISLEAVQKQFAQTRARIKAIEEKAKKKPRDGDDPNNAA